MKFQNYFQFHLGAAETTLLNLTSAYATFVNGGKKVDPTLISRIQDRRGKTIFKVKNRKCLGCENFIDHKAGLTNYPQNSKFFILEFSVRKQLIK